MSKGSGAIVRFAGVSKFYGEVLGVNGIDLDIGPGVTSFVGPNGSGKTTLMNLMTGLVRPSRGSVEVFGLDPAVDPATALRRIGYCTQFDTFPRTLRGFDFVERYLRLHGWSDGDARRGAERAIERVGMTEAAKRRIAGYSKGMKQRIKLAQSIAHDPELVILDEPLNGLDPLARAEVFALLRSFAAQGRAVVVSSHILHEVDELSDRVVLVHGGYIVAEGAIEGVRQEMVQERPLQVLVRCAEPNRLAARLFAEDHIVEARLDEDRQGLLVRTVDADRFYLVLNGLVAEGAVEIEAVLPADEDVQAVYRYLIQGESAQGAR